MSTSPAHTFTPSTGVQDGLGTTGTTLHDAGMDDLLRARLEAQHGVLTTRDAAECGCPRDRLSRLVSRGLLRRVHPGCFVDEGRLTAASPEGQRALTAMAVSRGFEGRHAASHLSAVALHRLPVIATPDTRVHLSRTTPGRPRRSRDVVIHPTLQPMPLCRVAGTLSVLPAWAIVQTTAAAGLVTGLAAADAALNGGKVTHAELVQAAAQVGSCHGVRDVRLMVEMADARVESPGESWTRVLFRGFGLPEPELQAPMHDEDGWLIGFADFFFRETRTVVEFDGVKKYAGKDGQRALVKEKHREDRLRSLGLAVVRLTWRDLLTPAVVDRRVRAAFRRQAA